MKYIPYDKPGRCQDHHGECNGAAFEYVLPALLRFACQHQLSKTIQDDVGDEDDQQVVVTDGFGKPAVQESVKESLHAASWATQTCEGVEDAFRCKSRFCRVDPVKEYQYDDDRQADK